MKAFTTAAAIIVLFTGQMLAQEYSISSPNGKLTVTADAGETLSWSVQYENDPVLQASQLKMELASGYAPGAAPAVVSDVLTEVRAVVRPLYGINSEIQDHYNQLTLKCEGGYSVEFRAYDNAAAYRFVTSLGEEITVNEETVELNLAGDYESVYIHAPHFQSSYEEPYYVSKISEIDDSRMNYLPIMFRTGERVLMFTEAGLRDYAGLYLNRTGDTSFKGVLPKAALEEKLVNDDGRNREVTKRKDYLAKTSGNRAFPWRVLTIEEEEKDLLASDIVYLLAPELEIEDPSWIQPGKVAWDWWNALNLNGVDFKTGVNTETYKYFIDFAAEHGIEYINLDEGWSEQTDLLKLRPEVNLKAIMEYANEREVKVILWVIWRVLDEQLHEALDSFEEMGVAGIKVDFMNRDDQDVVNYYWRVAEEAAKRKMLVNFHGAYKPTGLRRAYPNVVNREGVLGLEYSKWGEAATPQHDVFLPFTRMFAGPMDYTPGAMINRIPDHFTPAYEKPMSQGTRCHQLAMFVLYYAPLQMLCDAPTNYEREAESLEFIAGCPTVWDESIPLAGKAGEYAAIARRSGEDWYIGVLNGAEGRTVELTLDFLGEGNYEAVIYRDSQNSYRNAEDYEKVQEAVEPGGTLQVELAPGGGYAAKIVKLRY